MAPTANLFDLPPPSANEHIDVLVRSGVGRIERIVSWGHASPPGFWYDQAEGEWVTLISGEAELRLREPDEIVRLRPGDWIWLAPHRPHRVETTPPDTATVWLAVFLQ